ncbi:MAG: SMP-30/gluconolactonase/LRE family protein [Phycisphaerales bacterium JB063]
MRPLATILSFALLAVSASPVAAQLIPADAEPEKVADGYRFTEGPAAGPDGCIYFTDIPAELILKYDPETGETETVVEESGQANGLMFRGNVLFSCEHGTRTIGCRGIVPDSLVDKVGPVVDEPPVARSYRNVRLNSPNDLDIDNAGNFYFTDPRYGNRDSMEMDIEGVYYIGLGEEVRSDQFDRLIPLRIIDDLTRPNGIVLSPDESILYVADNGTNEIFAYDVKAPGEIENKRLFARLNDGEGGGADGMCVDALGRLYASGQGKIWVYNPDGSSAGVIEVGPQCTNCTFAADGKTLYITANHGLYRIELNTDEPLPAIEVGINKDGGILFEGEVLTLDAFAGRIETMASDNPVATFTVFADPEAVYGDFVRVLDILKHNDFRDIQLRSPVTD